MLIIRPNQMWALSSSASRSVLTKHAKSAHAATAQALGSKALEATVNTAVELCHQYGIEATTDQVRILDLLFVFGPDWQSPALRWIDEGLRNTAITSPSLRLRSVWRRALRRLARNPQWPSN